GLIAVLALAVTALRAPVVLGLDGSLREPFVVRLKRWAYGWAWLSLLLSLVVLFSNGEISLGFLRHLLPDRWLSYDGDTGEHACLGITLLPASVRTAVYWVLGAVVGVIVAASIVPLLMPGKVLASGQQPRRAQDLRWFRLIVGATLLGIPMLLFYGLARE